MWWLYFRGREREYCNYLSYNGCHNMKWLTNQKTPLLSFLIEKKEFQNYSGNSLYFMEHEIDYRVTALPIARKLFLT